MQTLLSFVGAREREGVVYVVQIALMYEQCMFHLALAMSNVTSYLGHLPLIEFGLKLLRPQIYHEAGGELLVSHRPTSQKSTDSE